MRSGSLELVVISIYAYKLPLPLPLLPLPLITVAVIAVAVITVAVITVAIAIVAAVAIIASVDPTISAANNRRLGPCAANAVCHATRIGARRACVGIGSKVELVLPKLLREYAQVVLQGTDDCVFSDSFEMRNSQGC